MRKAGSAACRVTLSALVLLATASPVHAQTGERDRSARTPLLLVGAGALLGVSFALDGEIRDASLDWQHMNRVALLSSDAMQVRVVVPALAASYLGSRAIGTDRLSRGLEHTAASLAAAGVASAVLKNGIGRRRPEGFAEPMEFRPVNFDSNWHSIPSGHTTIAFVLATALDAETDAVWVPFAAYPAAALVGWSRVRLGWHWASDVVAGAILGTTATRLMIGRLHDGDVSIGVSANGVTVSIPTR